MHDPQTAAKPSRHQHTVRRLETFSDIVIAFTLSELAFNLRLPERSRDVFTHPVHLIAFLGSFAFVCSFWWLHHRVFARLFYADALSVLLNFAFLASTVYVAYSLQLVTKFQDTTSLGLYGLSLGLGLLLLALMFAKGARDERTEADERERTDAKRTATRVGIAGAGLLVSSLLAFVGASARTITFEWLATIAVILALRVRERAASARGQSSDAPAGQR
ncbi:MAG: DUF1211 domain-containing protein [Candidatus Eremiobacteraeota bacterium]|nr:DUF1211 domain-containing protein [Candidatus Eremiobacteraeota bacterium]MBV8366820.1 DUF1211 domain-containing protein [Candidatus Eremiobacteraeota bacterium]